MSCLSINQSALVAKKTLLGAYDATIVKSKKYINESEREAYLEGYNQAIVVLGKSSGIYNEIEKRGKK